MEVVDVGSRPADEVLDLLFEGQALKSLLRGHGAACFVLVRPMAAQQFFRELIENSATLDATTRQHVAFVIFYGNRSGLVREGSIGYEPYSRREIRGGLRVRLDGLSISGDPDFNVRMAEQPTTLSQQGWAQFERRNDLFSEELGQLLRTAPENLNHPLLAHDMSRVATRLMERYQIRESGLPCMLFTDGDDLEKYLVVRLDPDKPLESLYSHVLRPLSDQFGALSRFWQRRDDFPSKKSVAKRASDSIPKLEAEIVGLAAEIELQRQIVPEEIRKHEEEISEILKARQQRLAALRVRDSEEVEVVRLLEADLATIARGERSFRSPGQQAMETAKLQKRLVRARQRLSTFNSEGAYHEKNRVRELRDTIERLRGHVSDLERKREQLKADTAREKQRVEDYSLDNLDREHAAIEQMARDLESTGYGPEVLAASRPSAFAALDVMFRNRLLGFQGSIPSTLESQPMRILFLAANPTTTSPLDLEEELRALEAELRSVKYRDQVVLTARHAVRPDDLVRYVRSLRPTIVHFSGHGSGRGIILRNDDGGYTEVTGPSLHRFFTNRGVQLVVLNACYTQRQAEHLVGAVAAVVGTTHSVGDVAARRFTVAFYRALGEGYSIREAFRDGGDAVVLDNQEDVFWSEGSLDEPLIIPGKN